MLFFLKNSNDGNIFYLVNKNQFLVGRKDCDILIQNDQSISRKHVILRLKENKVTIEDCASKYKTLHNGVTLEPNTEIELNIGDNIQFGICNSLYSFQKYEFVTTGTRLNNNVKDKLMSDLSILNAKYLPQWRTDCTHLTVEEITLTVKFLQALIEEKPVVIPTYWTKFANRIKKNLPPPNIDHYNKPPVAEALFNKIDISPNPKRRTLYKGKIFIFPSEQDKKQLEEVIKKAGGTSISWEKNSMPLKDIEKSPKEFLIIQTRNDIKAPDLNEIIKMFAKQGKRTIPLQEIATSIVHCSCERDCNPSFNRVGQVFPSSKPMEPTQNNALVENTESDHFSVQEFKSEKTQVIPDTFENNLGDSQFYHSLEPAHEIVVEKEISNSQSVKRSNCDEMEDNPMKKAKIENDAQARSNCEELEDNPIKKAKIENDAQAEVKKEKKDTFLSKPTTPKKRPNEDTVSDDPKEKKNAVLNPFALILSNKRSKTITRRDNDEEVDINKDNPFKLFIGSKKRANTDNSGQSSCKKKKNNNNSIFSSTRIDNISRDLSSFSYVSKIPKDFMNVTWMSKSTAKNITNNTNDIENQYDVEIKQFIEQFKNTIIIEVMEKVPLKERQFLENVDKPANGKVNFKLFKKVKPLNPQTKIIGKTNFTAMGPGSTTSIERSGRSFHNSDNETEETSKIKKKAPKKFIL